ncbi:hypothetical protein ACEPAF_3235 [Sanghuangporus sanghuang]|uniref:Kinesin-like protein n=1 Tax=Sanghuangporus baumii TaxID=108892 RepID=A0A9Q5I3S1_SANBA|nr:kinesin-domain-containing protein [Sanghuangporus baumii]
MATRKTAASRKVAAPARVTRAAAARCPAIVEASAQKAATEKTKPRKPLVNRNAAHPQNQKTGKAKAPAQLNTDDADREPIKAFLRIRPNGDTNDDDQTATPYLKKLSDSAVQMTDLSGSNRIRLHPQAQVYTFNHVFTPETRQSGFFTKTTLPLVQDLLQGQNGLIFTYGVTNSGKTYTIQGGTEKDTAGLLPRTLDVVFNSLEGLHSNAPYRPVRISGVERTMDDDITCALPELSEEKAIAAVLGEINSQDVDSTAVPVDKNYEYSIWISYAEVYNEKIFDLLSNDPANGDRDSTCATPQGTTNGIPRSKRIPGSSSSTWSNLASLASLHSPPDVLFVKRKALSLKKDPEGGGKYVAGLKCVRVRSAEEAKHVFRTGNINRRVFGTLTNAVSSRSHGIFTLRAVRIHRGDPSDVSVSRLSIVDLAGSERTKNTHNTGDRLKEAGNINKSLMVLGQCMEAMRSNQRRVAAMLAAPGRGEIDIANPGRGVKLAIIPFRHSKLTELFQDFFTGEQGGHAAMIVNVNPYDTGFDENSHVMRFAALAREVTTAPPTVPKANIRQTPTPTERVFKAHKTPAPNRRNVTITTGGTGTRKRSEARVEIIEEDEESDGDGEPVDVLVDALFEELEDLRIKLYESEMRCAIIEAETREEVMQEMEERMINMQRVFAERLKKAVKQSEAKTDAKIDMLHQFGAFTANSRRKTRSKPAETSIESTEAGSEIISNVTRNTEDSDEDEEDDSLEDSLAGFSEDEDAETTYDDSSTQSPLARKSHSEAKKGSSTIGLLDQDMGIDEMDADETMTAGAGTDFDEDEEDEEAEGSSAVTEEEEDEDEWLPDSEPKSTPKAKQDGKVAKDANQSPNPRSASGVMKLQKKLHELSLYADDDNDKEEDEVVSDIKEKSQLPQKKEPSKTARRSTRQKKY